MRRGAAAMAARYSTRSRISRLRCITASLLCVFCLMTKEAGAQDNAGASGPQSGEAPAGAKAPAAVGGLASAPMTGAKSGPARVVAVRVQNGGPRGRTECEIDDLVLVQLEPGNVRYLLDRAQEERQTLGLFLDGWFLKGIAALPEPGEPDTLRFVLSRGDDNKAAWNQILYRRFLISAAPAPITIGLENGDEVARSSATVRLMLMPALKAACLFAGILVFLLVMGYLSMRTALLRDYAQPLPDGQLTSFSLGRTQMAFWFVNCIVGYLFIWAITGASPALSNSVLALLGIGSGTALGSLVIDRSKQSNAPDAGTLAASPSRSLLFDLLQDGNAISLSRLQMVVWTGVLLFVFWGGILHTLAMPEFDNTSLTLMGLSAGTYLGFKIPEKQERTAEVGPSEKKD